MHTKLLDILSSVWILQLYFDTDFLSHEPITLPSLCGKPQLNNNSFIIEAFVPQRKDNKQDSVSLNSLHIVY